jgi:hypothetical protein
MGALARFYLSFTRRYSLSNLAYLDSEIKTSPPIAVEAIMIARVTDIVCGFYEHTKIRKTIESHFCNVTEPDIGLIGADRVGRTDDKKGKTPAERLC